MRKLAMVLLAPLCLGATLAVIGAAPAIGGGVAKKTHKLTVVLAGPGSGKVTSSPKGISCPHRCSHPFSTVTLTAVANPGSTFAGWSGGGCSGTGTCTITLSADTTVTATFIISSPAPPNTTITSAVIKRAQHKATFKFTGSGGAPPLHFQCKLDKHAWKSCTSPKTYRHLKPGKHVFRVRAVDHNGQADPTPAKKRFRI